MYCVYLTTYNGTKLPPNYIGSSTVERVESGEYFGSVCSKKWRSIFEQELIENKHLFSVQILSKHSTRKEATAEEWRQQVSNDVVKSNKFFNEAVAALNGSFGRDVSGASNPMYGRKRPDASARMSGSKNIATQDSVKIKLRKPKRIVARRPLTQETKDKISKTKLGKPSVKRGMTQFSKELGVVMELIRQHKTATKNEIINLLGLPIWQVTWILQKLRLQNKIQHIRQKKAHYWTLSERVIGL